MLLLSSDGGTNIAAALQVRLLNSTADIVIRSSRGLNSLGNVRQQRLPKLAVVDPLERSAGALVQALRHLMGWVQRRDMGQHPLLIGVLLMVFAGIPLFGARGAGCAGCL